MQVWKDDQFLKDDISWKQYIGKITAKGYRVILSACWFLNIIHYGSDWKQFYACDPTDFRGFDSIQFGPSNLITFFL